MASQSQLTYADLYEQAGVSIEKTPTCTRVAVAPTPGWWPIFHVCRWPGLFICFGLVVLLCNIPALPRSDWPPLLLNVGLYLLMLLALLAWGYIRTRRRIAFEVTPGALVLTVIPPIGSPSATAWRRHELREVRYSPINGKVLVRVTGKDLLEIFVSTNRRVAEHVGDSVGAALRDTPAGDFPPDALPLAPIEASRGQRVRRRIAIAACVVLAGAAVAMMFLVPMAMWPYLFIPAGIMLGTQKKEYWC